MKNLFTLSAILVATGLLFPSCGTHLTIAKRQHSKGYYVNISKDKKSAGKSDTEQAQEIIEENENRAAVSHGDPSKPRHVVKKAEAVETASLPEAVTSEKPAETSVVVETQPVQVQKHEKIGKSNRLSEKLSLKSEKKDVRTLKSNLKQEVKKLSKAPKFKKMENRHVDGLSLFWIVILILLILWLLGLLGGLGWFIHIVLVVAIVLLILWLLGVV